jgi:hypothetical protein
LLEVAAINFFGVSVLPAVLAVNVEQKNINSGKILYIIENVWVKFFSWGNAKSIKKY